MSNKLNPDVVTMINQIKFIYSNAYKKFINIDPARYINVDDLMKDLYVIIPKWDSHASVNYKNTYVDTTSYTINSNGYGYVYVSTNFKMDNILRIYSELYNKGVRKITINLSAFINVKEQETQIIKILMPFMIDDQKVIIRYDDQDHILFSYDKEKRILKTKNKSVTFLHNLKLDEMKNDVVYEDVCINIIMNLNTVELFYRKYEGASNMCIYCYDDDFTTCSIYYDRYGHNGIIYNDLKHESKVPPKLKFRCAGLGKKYYPMI